MLFIDKKGIKLQEFSLMKMIFEYKDDNLPSALGKDFKK